MLARGQLNAPLIAPPQFATPRHAPPFFALHMNIGVNAGPAAPLGAIQARRTRDKYELLTFQVLLWFPSTN